MTSSKLQVILLAGLIAGRGQEDALGSCKRFGTKAAAENIYHGTHDGRVAIEAWFHSPPHLKNMFGSKYQRVALLAAKQWHWRLASAS